MDDDTLESLGISDFDPGAYDFSGIDADGFDFDGMNIGATDLSGFDSGSFDLSQFDPGSVDLGQFDPNAVDLSATGIDPNSLDYNFDSSMSNADIDAMISGAGYDPRGYYNEETGEYIYDPNGGLASPLGDDSGTNASSMDGYTYDSKTGRWTTPSGQSYTPATGGSATTAKTGADIMLKAGAGAGTGGTRTISEIISRLLGGGTSASGGGARGASSGLESILPLLLLMLAANRSSGGGGSNATIPALSATQKQTPYAATQQAPGYRPGQGGITYFNPTQYTPRMAAGGGIADLYAGGGRLLRGPGDGVSDSIPAVIGGMAQGGQPARLARGEYVIDARTVAALGNGSTDAGAERLDEMRRKALATDRKAKVGADSKAYRHLKV